MGELLWGTCAPPSWDRGGSSFFSGFCLCLPILVFSGQYINKTIDGWLKQQEYVSHSSGGCEVQGQGGSR